MTAADRSRETPTMPKPERNARRTAVRVFATLVAVAFLAVTTLLLFLKTGPARRLIVGAVNRSIPGKLACGKLRYSLLKSRVELGDIRLVSADGAPIADVERVLVNWSWPKLLRGELRLKEVALVRLTADIEVNDAGRVNLLQALGASFGEPKPRPQPDERDKEARPHIVVDMLQITNAHVLYRMHSPPVTASVDRLNITGSADLADLSGHTAVHAGSLAFSGPSFQTRSGRLEMDTSWEAGDLASADLRLETDLFSLTATGSVRRLHQAPVLNAVVDMALDAHNTALALRRPKPSRGQIRLHLALEGAVNNPSARLDLTYDGGVLDGHPLDGVETVVRLHEGRFHVDRIDLRNGSSYLTATSSVHFLDPTSGAAIRDPILDLSVATTNLLIGDFVENIKGRMTGYARVRGPLSRPEGAMVLHADELNLGGRQALDGIDLRATLKDDRVRLDSLVMRVAPGQTLTAHGWLSRQKTFELGIESKGIQLRSVQELARHGSVEGDVSLRGRAGGSLAAPHAEASLAITGIALNGAPLNDMHLQASLSDRVVRAAGDLGFKLEAAMDLGSRVLDATAQFSGTDLAPYFLVAGWTKHGGYVGGHVRVQGSINELARLDVTGRLDRVAFTFHQKAIAEGRDLRFGFVKGELRIPGISMSLLGGGSLDLSGSWTTNAAPTLDARARIPLSLLGALWEGADGASGLLTVSAHAESSGGPRPEMTIECLLTDAGMVLPALEQKLHSVNGRLVAAPRAVRIETLTGKLDTGDFALSGDVQLSSWRPQALLLKFKGRAVPIHVPETLDLILDLDVNVTGDTTNMLLRGEALIAQGLYYRDVNLGLLEKLTHKSRPKPKAEARGVALPFVKDMRLDVTLKRQQPMLVDNNLAELTLSPDLRLSGTLGNPILGGRAEVESGSVSYKGIVFDIRRGVIDFTNPYRTEAALDVEAETRVREWTIMLHISGTADALLFELSSNPPEEHSDILSLLVLGKTSRELAGGEGAVTLSTSQMLTELTSVVTREKIKRATGLDTIQVETQGTTADAAGSTTVTVGKQLSRRLVLGYSVETRNGETTQKALAEYRLLETILLNAYEGSSGAFGGGVKWRLEFR